jgi:hypothetical protein
MIIYDKVIQSHFSPNDMAIRVNSGCDRPDSFQAEEKSPAGETTEHLVDE